MRSRTPLGRARLHPYEANALTLLEEQNATMRASMVAHGLGHLVPRAEDDGRRRSNAMTSEDIHRTIKPYVERYHASIRSTRI